MFNGYSPSLCSGTSGSTLSPPVYRLPALIKTPIAAFRKAFGNSFLLSLVASVVFMLPVAYIIGYFVIRRLYGESLDYAVIATHGVLLIGTDLIKLIWGTTPYPVNGPIGLAVPLGGLDLPVYRILIVISAVLLFLAFETFFQAIHYRPDRHRLFGGQRRGALPGA